MVNPSTRTPIPAGNNYAVEFVHTLALLHRLRVETGGFILRHAQTLSRCFSCSDRYFVYYVPGTFFECDHSY